MNATYTVFPLADVPGAYGYLVTSDRGHAERQETVPGASGFVRMTQAEAEAYAQALVAELTAPPAPEGEVQP